MESALPDEITIRRYLLGRLDTSPELAEQLEDRMLTDSAFSDTVGVIEDEIIEEYLDGVLDPSDRQAVEKHFLRPPERRQKLRLARQLNEHLGAEGEGAAKLDLDNQEDSPPPASWRFHWRTLIEVGAGAVVAVASAFYVVTLRHGFQSEIGKGQHELAQEQEHSAQLAQQMEELRKLHQPSRVLLTLIQPSQFREDVPLPDVEIGAATQKIHVEITLQGPPFADEYDVRLAPVPTGTGIAADEKPIWSKSAAPFLQYEAPSKEFKIPRPKAPFAASLMLDVPTKGIKPGKYTLVVHPLPGDAKEDSYSFEVKAPR